MSFFKDKQLKSKTATGGLVKAEEALSGKDVIACYFSAHWCPPCRNFTPLLKDHYDEFGGKVAIIFVSSDRSEPDMDTYYNGDHGDWFAIPFKDTNTVSALKKNCNVSGIPKLVIIDMNGNPLHAGARDDVTNKDPEECVNAWKAYYPKK